MGIIISIRERWGMMGADKQPAICLNNHELNVIIRYFIPALKSASAHDASTACPYTFCVRRAPKIDEDVCVDIFNTVISFEEYRTLCKKLACRHDKCSRCFDYVLKRMQDYVSLSVGSVVCGTLVVCEEELMSIEI